MVARLDLKTGDKLTAAVFSTIDDNVAELDSTKAELSDIPEVPDTSAFVTQDDIPEVPDTSAFVTQDDIDAAVPDTSEFVTQADIPEVPDVSEFVTQADIDAATSSLASRLDALEAASGGAAE